MVKQLSALAVLGVLSFAIAPNARAQPAQVKPKDVNSSDAREVPSAPFSSAQPFDHLDSSNLPPESPKSATAAESGLASPYALSAKVVPGQSWARATGGYDSAAQAFRMSSSAEGALSTRIVFRVDYDHGPATSATDRISFGFRLQLLNQNANGLDLGAGIFYQPSDFRKEGNMVAALMLQRRFNQVAVIGNVLVGSDPEGDDHELDSRLATLVRISRVVEVGVDGRFRSVYSMDAKRIGTTMVDWELAVLPSAVLMIGPFTLIGEAGFSALQEAQFAGQSDEHKNLRTGILMMSGLGAAF